MMYGAPGMQMQPPMAGGVPGYPGMPPMRPHGMAMNMPQPPGGPYGASNPGAAGPPQQRQSRPGDWHCPCGAQVFAFRDRCFKCHMARPEGAGSAAQAN